MKVLVREKIGDSGVQLLRDAGLEVEIGIDWDQAELERRIGEFDGILIRSATQLDAGLLERAERLKAVGRAGVGVDNVDVEAATKRGVIVANAPQSNVITAAEHTLALLLALARKVPQAHESLTGGAWERSEFSGVELYEKTLGVLGFGRIGQLVAQRALGFGMRVVAFDAYVSEERFRELGVDRAESSGDLYSRADFVTVHLPVTPETENWLDADAFAAMKDGVRVINVARGKLMDEEALRAALDSGKVAGAALDVFREEPATENPLFDYPNVVVTPHLGASTTEATGRAGYQAAEQVVAALTGGVVTSAVNVPSIAPEDLEALGPFLPLAHDLGRIASSLAERTSVDAVEVEYLGRIADRDTRLLTVQVLKGVLGRAHRGGGQRGERAHDRRGARHRRVRDEQLARARLHRFGARGRGERRRADQGGGHHTGADASSPPVGGVGVPLQPPARGASRGVPLRGSAGDAGPGRDGARQSRHQHHLCCRWASA